MSEPLSPADLSMLAELIKGHHIALAVQWFGAAAVDPESLKAVVDAGLLTPEQLEESSWGTLGQAYALGAGKAQGQVAGPAKTLTPWQEKQAAAARQHGAAMVVGLGNKLAGDLVTLTLSSDNQQAQKYKQAIAEGVAQGIEAGKTWSQTRSALGEALDGDHTRDLGRIAATEVQRAVNAGYADQLVEDFGGEALAAVIPSPDACPQCRKHYLEDGKPRIFKLSELPPSTANFKKKQGEWVPTIPPLHPWCGCQLVHVEPGWGFDDNWTLLPG